MNMRLWAATALLLWSAAGSVRSEDASAETQKAQASGRTLEFVLELKDAFSPILDETQNRQFFNEAFKDMAIVGFYVPSQPVRGVTYSQHRAKDGPPIGTFGLTTYYTKTLVYTKIHAAAILENSGTKVRFSLPADQGRHFPLNEIQIRLEDAEILKKLNRALRHEYDGWTGDQLAGQIQLLLGQQSDPKAQPYLRMTKAELSGVFMSGFEGKFHNKLVAQLFMRQGEQLTPVQVAPPVRRIQPAGHVEQEQFLGEYENQMYAYKAGSIEPTSEATLSDIDKRLDPKLYVSPSHKTTLLSAPPDWQGAEQIQGGWETFNIFSGVTLQGDTPYAYTKDGQKRTGELGREDEFFADGRGYLWLESSLSNTDDLDPRRHNLNFKYRLAYYPDGEVIRTFWGQVSDGVNNPVVVSGALKPADDSLTAESFRRFEALVLEYQAQRSERLAAFQAGMALFKRRLNMSSTEMAGLMQTYLLVVQENARKEEANAAEIQRQAEAVRQRQAQENQGKAHIHLGGVFRSEPYKIVCDGAVVQSGVSDAKTDIYYDKPPPEADCHLQLVFGRYALPKE